jgi:hypothetical protein
VRVRQRALITGQPFALCLLLAIASLYYVGNKKRNILFYILYVIVYIMSHYLNILNEMILYLLHINMYYWRGYPFKYILDKNIESFFLFYIDVGKIMLFEVCFFHR